MKEYKIKKDDELKWKVMQIVDAYKARFPEDYKAVVEHVKLKRDELIKLSRSGNGMGTEFIDRPLNEYSEILMEMFVNSMSEQENADFVRTKEVQRWFTKRYPEFSLVERV